MQLSDGGLLYDSLYFCICLKLFRRKTFNEEDRNRRQMTKQSPQTHCATPLVWVHSHKQVWVAPLQHRSEEQQKRTNRNLSHLYTGQLFLLLWLITALSHLELVKNLNASPFRKRELCLGFPAWLSSLIRRTLNFLGIKSASGKRKTWTEQIKNSWKRSQDPDTCRVNIF